jgi:DNA-directed RNA polymerase specialized sigma24 family protein
VISHSLASSFLSRSYLCRMHNFHRAKRTRSTRESWKWVPPRVTGGVTPQEEESPKSESEEIDVSETETEDAEELETHISEVSHISPQQQRGEYVTYYYRDWSSDIAPEELRIREKKGYNSILYLGEASLISVPLPSGVTEKGVILFRFRGQAFLLQ